MLIDKMSPLHPDLSDEEWLVRHHHPRLDLVETRDLLSLAELQVFRAFHTHLNALAHADPESGLISLFLGSLPDKSKARVFVWSTFVYIESGIAIHGVIPPWLENAAGRYRLVYDGLSHFSKLALPRSRRHLFANLGPDAEPEPYSGKLDATFLAFYRPT